MNHIRILMSRIASLFRSRKLDVDLDDELRAHIDLATEANVAFGMTPQQARTAALRNFGGVAQTREAYRQQRGIPLLESLGDDLRFALRQLRNAPGFTFVAVLTLALGIGATTAIFSVVDAVVLKPLPFPSADRLMHVRSVVLSTGNGGVASYLDFVDWRSRNHVFDGMAAIRTGDFTLIGPREPLHVQGAVASAQLFSVLGVSPFLGRNFTPDEDTPAAAGGIDPVILSYGLWQREFGADASILGRVIQLGDQRYTVAGVMPRGFQYPIQAEPIELWTTVAEDARGGADAMTNQRGAHYLDVVGLLKPGIAVPRAQAEMAAIAASLNKEHPENKPRTVQLMPELQHLSGPLRAPLLVLLGTVGCILLIVCANMANLQLARGTRRHKEIAVRAALGASRFRVVRQLLMESVVLGLAGGVMGLALALVSLRFLVRLLPPQVPRANDIGLDSRLLIFTILISLLTGILFGLAPALRAARISLTASLNDTGRESRGDGRSSGRLRNALVVSEIALSVIPLLGAAQLTQSFLHLTQVDPGFDPHHVLTFQLDAPPETPEAAPTAFYREAVARIGALPGVTSASAAASLPLTGDNIGLSVEIEGQPTPMSARPSADFNAVEPKYFSTLGTTLLEGRDISWRDDKSSTPVVVVNSTFARRFFPNQNPLGKHVRPGISNGFASAEPPMREIVGVIADLKQSDLGSDSSPEIYAPLAQCPFNSMFIAVRTVNDPRSVVAAARSQIASLDKHLPLYHVKTLDQYFADSVATPRLVTMLMSSFAVLAVMLACLGVYGVISYTVAQRTHEIGIRMALGADAGMVMRWVLIRGSLLALAGVSIGLGGALALAHLIASVLYGIRAMDPVTFIVAPLALLAIAILAGYIPARRAATIDPMRALRTD